MGSGVPIPLVMMCMTRWCGAGRTHLEKDRSRGGLQSARALDPPEGECSSMLSPAQIRGKHLSDTTCLTHVFFKRGEWSYETNRCTPLTVIRTCSRHYRGLRHHGLSASNTKRGLEYGLRFFTEIYGSKPEKTVFREYLQEGCFIISEIFERLRKPPGVYGRM